MRSRRFIYTLFILMALPNLLFAQDQAKQVDWDALNKLITEGSNDTVTQNIRQSKVVLLDFWASWCGPCRQSFPWMNAMKAQYQKQGLSIIAINLDSEKDEAKAFLSEVKADFTIAFDQEGMSAEMLGVEAMPMSYLISSTGEVLHQMAGFNASKKARHEAHIRQSLGLE
jgi:thiol-disulfide isomerase/thioredoxin